MRLRYPLFRRIVRWLTHSKRFEILENRVETFQLQVTSIVHDTMEKVSRLQVEVEQLRGNIHANTGDALKWADTVEGRLKIARLELDKLRGLKEAE